MPHYPVETALTPALFKNLDVPGNAIIVLTDILRATTTICTALYHGVEAILPVATLEEAIEYKRKGYWVAAEREGRKPDFADLGNSAFHFMDPGLRGKTLVYSTTNGTQAFEQVRDRGEVVFGAFVNLSALAAYLLSRKCPVVILCSGWKGRFNLEDTVFAGALTARLCQNEEFYPGSDAAHAAVDLWHSASPDLMDYHQKAEHRERLRRLGLDDILEYTFTLDLCPVVPRATQGVIRLIT